MFIVGTIPGRAPNYQEIVGREASRVEVRHGGVLQMQFYRLAVNAEGGHVAAEPMVHFRQRRCVRQWVWESMNSYFATTVAPATSTASYAGSRRRPRPRRRRT